MMEKIPGARLFNAFVGKTMPSAKEASKTQSSKNDHESSQGLGSYSNEAITGRALAQAQIPDLPDLAILYAEKLLKERRDAGEPEPGGPSKAALEQIKKEEEANGSSKTEPPKNLVRTHINNDYNEHPLSSRKTNEKLLNLIKASQSQPPNHEITVTE